MPQCSVQHRRNTAVLFHHPPVLEQISSCYRVAFQAKATCSGICSGRSRRSASRRRTCERWPTVTFTSSSATGCSKSLTSTRRSPTHSRETSPSPTISATGYVYWNFWLLCMKFWLKQDEKAVGIRDEDFLNSWWKRQLLAWYVFVGLTVSWNFWDSIRTGHA